MKMKSTYFLKRGKWADYAFKVGFDALSTNKTEQAVAAEIEYEFKEKKASCI